MKLVSVFIFSFLILALNQEASAQATLFTEDFESPATWTTNGVPNPNDWIINTCALNGPSGSGSNALYITKGGAVPGCGASGMEQFAYDNSPSGTEQITIYTSIDGTCASNLSAQFDYRIDGVALEDYLELVYSTDGGSSFQVAGTAFINQTNWTATTVSLPALLNNSSFLLGFRFTYNNTTVNGFPPAIDNLSVIGDDSTPPVITCPTSLDLTVDANCDAIVGDYLGSKLALFDNCTDSADILVTQSIPEFTVLAGSPGDSETITLFAEDEAGNIGQCSFTLNIIDGTPPNIACPSDTNIYVDLNCEGVLGSYSAFALVDDNCTSALNIAVTQNPAPGLLISGIVVETIVELTATDDDGNSSTCQFVARTVDSIPAMITCPGDTMVYANTVCQGTLADYTSDAVVFDNCAPLGSLVVSQSPIPGSMISSDQVITLTVTGGIPNNPQTCTFNAILIDTLDPGVICPIPTVLYTNSACAAIVPNYAGSAIIAENCDPSPTIVQTPAPGTVINTPGINQITLTVTDDSGNIGTCQFNQPVLDTISPSVTCPPNQIAYGDANCFALTADYTSLVTAADNCSGLLSINQNIAPGTTFSGNLAIVITVEDAYGNDNSCSFILSVEDTLAPAITCPTTQSVGAGSACTAILSDYTSASVVADNCSLTAGITLSQTPAPSSVLNLGTHPITIIAEDENGNTNSCQFDVQIADLTAPTVTTCAPNQTHYADVNCEAVIGDYTSLLVTTDNCSPPADLVITQNPPSGTTITTSTIVNFTILDEAGNSVTCATNVVFLDTILPSVTCPGTQNMTINSSCEYTMPDLGSLVSGTDNCSLLGDMTITQNPPAGSLQNGITAVLITLTDEAGNSATCTSELLPIDTDAPEITCPTPAPVNNGTSCTYVIPNYGTVSLILDNCSDYSISQNPLPGSVVSAGTTAITLIVTDAGGNSDQCTFDLQVIENELPVINCPSNVSTCNPMIVYSDPVFSDNCAVSMVQTDGSGLSSGMLFPIGTTILEYTATDSSGNQATCQFNVEVLDYPSQATIVPDSLFFCEQNGVVIEAVPATSGTGEWTVLSGQGVFNNQFANLTGVNNIASGVNTYVWTISSASCGFTSDTLVVVNSQQDIQASTQDTLYGCSDNSIDLIANSPLFGTGTWTTSGGGTILNDNAPVTTASFTNGWQDFIWTISNPGCPSTSDTLAVFGLFAPQIVTQDTLVCLEDDEILLLGSIPASGQYATWSFATGSVQIASPNANPTSASDFYYGTTMIVYQFSHPECPSQSDTIVVSGTLCNEFDPIIPTVFTPGNLDGSNDVFTIDFLNTVYPECNVLIFNRWGSVVYESVGYEDPWDGTFNGEALPMGTYFYQIDLNDGSGKQFKGDISIIK